MSEEEERKARKKAQNKAYREANKGKEKARQKAYREANKEKIIAQSKAYREANPERVRAADKAYQKATKEKIAAKKKAYREAHKEEIAAHYEANKEKIAARGKAWREANKDKIAAYNYNKANPEQVAARRNSRRAWREANREDVVAYMRKRRKRWFEWLQAHDSRITQVALQKWSWLVRERDAFTCQECGAKEKLHAHHMIPLKVCPEKALDLDNGITFCSPCHYEWHAKNPMSSF